MKFRIVEHEVVDSTNERALASVADGTARHGDVHVATAQSRGRGRLGRRWESASGEGLYLSVVLLPLPPALSPVALTMATGLGVLAAVHDLGASGAALEWPNDVVVGPAKLAGVLVESRGLDPTAPHYVVGVGLNVAQREFPPELTAEREVTSLRRLGLACDVAAARARVLEGLAAAFDRLQEDERGLVADYLRSIGCDGARVRVRVGERALEGRLTDFSLANGVELEDADGVRARTAIEHVSSMEPLSEPRPPA